MCSYLERERVKERERERKCVHEGEGREGGERGEALIPAEDGRYVKTR